MQFYYDNYIADAGLTASSTPTGQIVSYLQEPQLAKSYTFSGNDEYVIIDLGSSKSVGAAIIDIGNLTDSATVTLEANTSDSWTSPAYTASMTYGTTCYYKTLSETYRYWRISIEDISVSEISIGYIYVGGSALQMPAISQNATLYYGTTNEANISISNQVFENAGYEFLETTFAFSRIYEDAITICGKTVATRKQILSMWSKVRNTQPMWVMLWEENLDEYPPLFCIINQNNIEFSKIIGKKEYQTSISLREVH